MWCSRCSAWAGSPLRYRRSTPRYWSTFAASWGGGGGGGGACETREAEQAGEGCGRLGKVRASPEEAVGGDLWVEAYVLNTPTSSEHRMKTTDRKTVNTAGCVSLECWLGDKSPCPSSRARDMGRYGEIWGDIPLLGAGNPMQSVHASASERSSSRLPEIEITRDYPRLPEIIRG